MGKIIQNKDTRKTIIYARISSNGQKDDLKNQVHFLKQYANSKGIIVDDIFEDIGSGLNYNRKKWNKLLEDCMLGLIKQVIIYHKDRFIRFGYEWFERFLKANGVELIIVNNEELSPKEEMVQDLISIIHQSLGICRYLYNSYLAKNKELYELYKQGKLDKKQAFMSAIDFDKYINNDIKVQNEFKWIDLCGSKSRKKSICNAETAFKKFFKGESKFPKFKKKKNQNDKLYFPKNNKTDWKIKRHKINIPTLGWCKIKEKGYIPTNKIVKSGTVSYKAGKYYVSVLCEVSDYNNYSNQSNEGIGVDLGIKDLAIVSNIDKPFKNINKTKRIKKLEKKLKRKQRQISRKYQMNKEGKKFIKTKNIIKLETQTRKINQQLTNIRHNYIHNITTGLIKQKPSFITIEDLNIKGMMKNRHLAKAVAQQCFYEFKRQLEYKCLWNNIELRIVDRYYPSSKTCNCCGYIKKDLKLSDRIFVCPKCGVIEDRDKNASYNLRDAKLYKIA